MPEKNGAAVGCRRVLCFDAAKLGNVGACSEVTTIAAMDDEDVDVFVRFDVV